MHLDWNWVNLVDQDLGELAIYICIYNVSLPLSHLAHVSSLIAAFSRFEVDTTLWEHGAKFKFDVYSLETFGIGHELETYIFGIKTYSM